MSSGSQQPVPVDMVDDPEQRTLDHIAEVSRNARASWFGLLALLVFVGVTLAAHEDRAFFVPGVRTELPLIGVSVPAVNFFIAAPILVAALYIYLQLYLLNLWDALADAPARLKGGLLADRVLPTMIAHGALWYRNRHALRRWGEAVRCYPQGRSGFWAMAITVALVSLFAPFILLWLWWTVAATHDLFLTGFTGVCLLAAVWFGATGFRVAEARMRDPGGPRTELATWSMALSPWSILVAWVFAGLTVERVGLFPSAPLMARADLADAELTVRPPDWKSWETWTEDFRATWFRDHERPFRDDWERENGRATGATGRLRPEYLTARDAEIESEGWERYRAYLASLDTPDLRGADLRGATLYGAFLPGTTLGCTRQEIRDDACTPARLQGADLRGAEMQGAVLRRAEMRGADLIFAEMQGADLRGAEMQGAVLALAEMQGADLRGAEMQRADLRGAEMQGAVLRDAEMQGADLRYAKMQGADLSGAEMEGADLRDAEMRGANLLLARMQGANLSRAEMQDANCFLWATFNGAPAQSANLTCNGLLTAQQLSEMIGNERTTLPRGLSIPDCWREAPATLDATLGLFPESDRDDLRAEWLCNGRAPEPTGRWEADCDEDGAYHDWDDGQCYVRVTEPRLRAWREGQARPE